MIAGVGPPRGGGCYFGARSSSLKHLWKKALAVTPPSAARPNRGLRALPRMEDKGGAAPLATRASRPERVAKRELKTAPRGPATPLSTTKLNVYGKVVTMKKPTKKYTAGSLGVRTGAHDSPGQVWLSLEGDAASGATALVTESAAVSTPCEEVGAGGVQPERVATAEASPATGDTGANDASAGVSSTGDAKQGESGRSPGKKKQNKSRPVAYSEDKKKRHRASQARSRAKDLSEKKKRIEGKVPADVHARLAVYSATRGKTKSEIMSSALAEFFDRAGGANHA